jgi:hypothetical protein
MTVLRPRVPIRFESVEKMVNGHDLISLIVPVEEGLRKFDQIHDDMTASLCGAFLILRGDTGSGKTPLVHTLKLFRKGVQTVSIKRDESILEHLRDSGPSEGVLRVVVIESREALSDTSDVEIESIILAINTFVRSKEGEQTIVVWPCTSEGIADKLVESARQIGGEALLGVEEPVFHYRGPARSDYLRITRKTIATFNSGASLADLESRKNVPGSSSARPRPSAPSSSSSKSRSEETARSWPASSRLGNCAGCGSSRSPRTTPRPMSAS